MKKRSSKQENDTTAKEKDELRILPLLLMLLWRQHMFNARSIASRDYI